MTDKRFYMESLYSEECLCGREKKKGKSFCYRCFCAIPYEMKDGLYKAVGQGYEEAFEAAVRYLQKTLWEE